MHHFLIRSPTVRLFVTKMWFVTTSHHVEQRQSNYETYKKVWPRKLKQMIFIQLFFFNCHRAENILAFCFVSLAWIQNYWENCCLLIIHFSHPTNYLIVVTKTLLIKNSLIHNFLWSQCIFHCRSHFWIQVFFGDHETH